MRLIGGGIILDIFDTLIAFLNFCEVFRVCWIGDVMCEGLVGIGVLIVGMFGKEILVEFLVWMDLEY
ncbi:hypothetical protein T11_6485, partial [Trichinella zimbabwensis]